MTPTEIKCLQRADRRLTDEIDDLSSMASVSQAEGIAQDLAERLAGLRVVRGLLRRSLGEEKRRTEQPAVNTVAGFTLAQAAELQRVKALAKSAEVRFAEDRDDQDLALRDAMRRLAELETALRDLLDVSFPAIGADPDTEKYLRQKYDEFTEQAKNLLGIKDTEA